MILSSVLAGLLTAAQPAEAEIEVLDAIFYAQDGRNASASPVATSVIPNRPVTSCYGWVLRVTPQPRSVAIFELFELPAPARQWTTDPAESAAVAGNQTSATTVFQADLSEGIITHGWCVAEGDPEGPHRIRVYHGDRLLHDFRFDVVAETR